MHAKFLSKLKKEEVLILNVCQNFVKMFMVYYSTFKSCMLFFAPLFDSGFSNQFPVFLSEKQADTPCVLYTDALLSPFSCA